MGVPRKYHWVVIPQFRGTSSGAPRGWRWRRRRSGSKLVLAVLPLAIVLAWPSAPMIAQAASASRGVIADSTCLLGMIGCSQTTTPGTSTSGSPTPSCLLGLVGCGSATGPTSGPCVGGIVLCGGNVINQPTPCVPGSLLCGSPPPTPCTGGEVLCPGTVLGPGDGPGGGPGGRHNPAGTTGNSQGLPPGTANASVALGVPPGVGLVPAALGSVGASAPNPNGFSDLLSLSIRGGLAAGGSQLWPALAMLQAVLLLVIVGAFAARQVLEASKQPQG